MLDSMYDRNLDEPPVLTVPEGRTARQVAAESRRGQLRPVLGAAADALSDAEVNDSFYFTLFPNFHPWGAFNRIVYRFRPHAMNVDEAIMECLFLSPFPTGERPPPAPVHWLDADSDWTKAPQLGSLARVFNQDTFNLPNVQLGTEGLAAGARHIRPLRGVEDPPLAPAPRRSSGPDVSRPLAASLEDRQAIVDVVIRYATGASTGADWSEIRVSASPIRASSTSPRGAGGRRRASRLPSGPVRCVRRTATSTAPSTCRRTTS